ncbi:MAG: hypothetical protein NC393_07785 [Clostridium sp.]|nr:hypothetical protein [Clostridium sp.]MCM1172014.1 hypothetical protein [Clostridium sp.]MCM1209362.1 hypothetical protein [Ruminococcus sp.]
MTKRATTFCSFFISLLFISLLLTGCNKEAEIKEFNYIYGIGIYDYNHYLTSDDYKVYKVIEVRFFSLVDQPDTKSIRLDGDDFINNATFQNGVELKNYIYETVIPCMLQEKNYLNGTGVISSHNKDYYDPDMMWGVCIYTDTGVIISKGFRYKELHGQEFEYVYEDLPEYWDALIKLVGE